LGQREGAVENLVNVWRGRRVFLTGHTGFKGGWLALWLAKLGAQVRGYALDPATEPNLFTVANVASVVEDIRGDLLDRPRIERSLQEFAPEVVFHLAAQPLVRRSYADPVGTYATNVLGTVHVLEAVRKTPSVQAVVCVTTDKCYENREWVWPYRETDPLGGHDPYSSSKACAEMVSAAYRNSFFTVQRPGEHQVALATARAGNVIGGGDWSEDRLIPDLIRGFQSGTPVRIRRPNAVRPWQHVLEPARGYMILAERLLAGDLQAASAFNFGPDDQDVWPVERIADHLASAWGPEAGWIRDADPGVHEAGLLRLDSSKARKELEWRPQLSTETGLNWTVQWYGSWQARRNMYAETLTQIECYEGLLAKESGGAPESTNTYRKRPVSPLQ
jgi:CDP-glucose 4,6-dehydratase